MAGWLWEQTGDSRLGSYKTVWGEKKKNVATLQHSEGSLQTKFWKASPSIMPSTFLCLLKGQRLEWLPCWGAGSQNWQLCKRLKMWMEGRENYNWYLLIVRSDPLHFYGFFFFFFGVAILLMVVGVCVKTSSYDCRIFYFSL